MPKKSFLCAALFAVCAAAFAQAPSDPSQFIGLTLADLYGRYGVPKTVYPVRGAAAWQDDVVFLYDAAEFFVSGNRVWQVKIHSAFNIREGDPKAQVELVMGPGQDYDTFTIFRLPGSVWPLSFRVNWDGVGRAQALYVYRSDF
jgi:hypothetical protein